MSDDYLWDKSGEPDPDVAALERTLAPAAHQDRPDAPWMPGAPPHRHLHAVPSPAPDAPAPHPPRARKILAASTLAALALAAAAVLAWRAVPRAPVAHLEHLPEPPSLPLAPAPPANTNAWLGVTRVAGAPICERHGMTGDCMLHVGQWLETDDRSTAQIALAKIGTVRVDPNSRVSISSTSDSEHRLVLARGRIEAHVDAPPRIFQVLTPSANAVDLGCAYTLEVDDTGAGVLSVTSGHVSLEWENRGALVPAGASCHMKPGSGPGLPCFDDATTSFKHAVRELDAHTAGGDWQATVDEASAVRAALKEARVRDSLTIWHLLFRVDGALRREVYERLRVLVPPPEGVGEAEAMALDQERLVGWKRRVRKTW